MLESKSDDAADKGSKMFIKVSSYALLTKLTMTDRCYRHDFTAGVSKLRPAKSFCQQ